MKTEPKKKKKETFYLQFVPIFDELLFQPNAMNLHPLLSQVNAHKDPSFYV